MVSGIRLTFLIGRSQPRPVPSWLLGIFESLEVTLDDEGRSGFQILFRIGRIGPTGRSDYRVFKETLLDPFNRVVILVTFNGQQRVLMDGVITNHQFAPNRMPGSSTLAVTGEDVSLIMDLEEKIVEHPAQEETTIVTKIIEASEYAEYKLQPTVIPLPIRDCPNRNERIPIQHCTDLQYLQHLAQRHGYVFYIIPGPLPLTNTAYWGPPNRLGRSQSALSVNMGPNTNVTSINFQYNALAPMRIAGQVPDKDTNQPQLVQILSGTRPPLVTEPGLATQNRRRTALFDQACNLNQRQVLSRAQGMTDKSTDEVVSVSGELDVLRYGDLLQPRSLVNLRGVGGSYDGQYYVKRVTHTIREEDYQQTFTLTREGVGSRIMKVMS